jgi:hypothetical protein
VAINAPANYAELLQPLPERVRISNRAGAKESFVHLFVSSRSDLAKKLPSLRKKIADDGVLWVSWPKKSSGVAIDIAEDVIREIALPLGLVDIKVCAVDETWSGLKLVVRRELRRREGGPR